MNKHLVTAPSIENPVAKFDIISRLDILVQRVRLLREQPTASRVEDVQNWLDTVKKAIAGGGVMNLTTEWHQTACIDCKALFAMPKATNQRYRDSHKSFFCPYCKSGAYYPQETDEEKLVRRLRDEQRCCINARDEANSLERSLIATKGHVTRLKKKVSTS